MVPADWQHPRYSEDHYPAVHRGRFIPLYDGGFAGRDAEWTEGWQKWQEGLCEDYSGDEKWAPIAPEYKHMRYTDYAGARPSPDDFMPDWPAEQRTHWVQRKIGLRSYQVSPSRNRSLRVERSGP